MFKELFKIIYDKHLVELFIAVTMTEVIAFWLWLSSVYSIIVLFFFILAIVLPTGMLYRGIKAYRQRKEEEIL